MEVVITNDTYLRKIRIFRQWLNLEGEGWGEGSVATFGVAEEKTIRLDGVGREEEATDGAGGEVVGLL